MRVPSASESSRSRATISACGFAFAAGLRGVLAALPVDSCCTRCSTSRTDQPCSAACLASEIAIGTAKGSNARAAPISSWPACTSARISAGNSSSRSRLLTAARERPTASAAAAWVRSNSSIRRCSACASSSGLRSSRWMFSISAIATTVRSSTTRTTTGISLRPARCEARQRRSPAMISYVRPPLPSAPTCSRTTIGWITPCARIEEASSSSLASSIERRGWYLPGTIASTGRLRSWSPGNACSGNASAAAFGPSSASSPRPRPRFLPAPLATSLPAIMPPSPCWRCLGRARAGGAAARRPGPGRPPRRGWPCRSRGCSGRGWAPRPGARCAG